MNALTVANYLLCLGGEAGEDNDISNLKLQKLLYYAQGFSLAALGKPCFSDAVVAWQHGPVVQSVYAAYKNHGSNVIPAPVERPNIDEDVRDVLDEVFEVYGQFSAYRLRNMTHEESPWKMTANGAEIPHEAMKQFFITRLRA